MQGQLEVGFDACQDPPSAGARRLLRGSASVPAVTRTFSADPADGRIRLADVSVLASSSAFSSALLLSAEDRRRNSHMPGEDPGEVRGVGIADLTGDAGDRTVGIGQ